MPARITKACSGCGKSIPAGAWCSRCAVTDPDAPQRPAVESNVRRPNPGGHWSQKRNRTVQQQFRDRLIRVYGERCMAVGGRFDDLEHGHRCSVTVDLQAHHGKDGDIDMLLCREHHKAIDEHAR